MKNCIRNFKHCCFSWTVMFKNINFGMPVPFWRNKSGFLLFSLPVKIIQNHVERKSIIVHERGYRQLGSSFVADRSGL